MLKPVKRKVIPFVLALAVGAALGAVGSAAGWSDGVVIAVGAAVAVIAGAVGALYAFPPIEGGVVQQTSEVRGFHPVSSGLAPGRDSYVPDQWLQHPSSPSAEPLPHGAASH